MERAVVRLTYEYVFRCQSVMAKDREWDRSPLNPRQASRLADLFGALSDASRLRIVDALMGGEMNVSALARVADISESSVSHHLRNLRQMQLVRTRKEGRHVFYSLDDEHIAEMYLQGLSHLKESEPKGGS